MRKAALVALVVSTALASKCHSKPFYKSMGFKATTSLGNKCTAGQLALTGWSVEIRKVRVQANAATPTSGTLASRQTTGTIKNMNITGTLTANLEIVLCPTPPACIATMDGPKSGTTRVDFAMTANYEWVFDGNYTYKGTEYSRPAILKSDIHISRFDVKNVWSGGDAILKKMFKKAIKRQTDRAVHKQLVTVFSLGNVPPDNDPVYNHVYKSGYSPYSGGGFCN